MVYTRVCVIGDKTPKCYDMKHVLNK